VSRQEREVQESIDRMERDCEAAGMSRQAIIRGKSISHKGIITTSDTDGNVIVSSPENSVKLSFTEGEAIALSENLSDLIEWVPEK